MCNYLINLRFTFYFNLRPCLQIGFVITVINHSKPSIRPIWSFDIMSSKVCRFFPPLPLATLKSCPWHKELRDGQSQRLKCRASRWRLLLETLAAFPSLLRSRGKGWTRAKGGGLPWKTNISASANLQMAPVFIQLRIGQEPVHHWGTAAYVRAMRWNLRLIHNKWDGIEQQGCWEGIAGWGTAGMVEGKRREGGTVSLPRTFLTKASSWETCFCWFMS